MSKHFPILISLDKDGVFIVQCPLFKGCRSYGHTIDEAMTNIKEAIAVCLDDEDYIETSAFIGIRDVEMAIAG